VASAVAVLAAFALTGAGPTAYAQDATVALMPNPTLGTLLTDASGWTVYTWDGDSPGVSNCFDACANAWPAFTSDVDIVQPDGIPGTLDWVDRGDGTWQISLDGWPLYYFARDVNPGDANGDGINAFGATWHVVVAAPPPPPVAQNPPSPPPPPPPPIATAPPAPVLPPPATPAPALPPAPPVRPNVPVTISDFQFQPATMNVNVGDTVMWTNNGRTAHTSTSDSQMWDSRPINPNGTFSFTFTTTGTFSYHCAIHPNMRGTVVVGSGGTFGPPNPNQFPQGGPFYNSPDVFGSQPYPYGNQPFPTDQFGNPIVPPFPPNTGPLGGPNDFQPQIVLPAPPNGTVILTWLPTPSAQSYRIYTTNVNQPTNFAVQQTVPQVTGSMVSSATVSGLLPGQTYFIQVRAVDQTGLETPAPVRVIPVGGAPIPAPAGVVVTAPSLGGLTLTWAAAPGAASYRVLQATSPNGPFTAAPGGTVNGTSATITGDAPNTTYYFQVVAVDSAGNTSSPSVTITGATGATTMAAPINVSLATMTSNTVTLTWSPVTNAASYRINASTSASGPWTQATITNPTTTGATVTGLSPSTVYFFQVSAVDASGNVGTPSLTVTGSTTT